jgi:hypothetical protein
MAHPAFSIRDTKHTSRGGFTTGPGGASAPLQITAKERGISAMEQKKEVLEAQLEVEEDVSC